jgi:hypothetical protein
MFREEKPPLTADATLGASQHRTAGSQAASSSSSMTKIDYEKDLEKEGGLPPANSESDHDEPQGLKKEVEQGREANVVVPQGISPMDPSQFPEGGREAWIVVLGAWLGIGSSFGWINGEIRHNH